MTRSQIELLNYMMKNCSSMTASEIEKHIMKEDWTDSNGYTPSSGIIKAIHRKMIEKQKMMKQVNKGVTVFINGKPQR